MKRVGALVDAVLDLTLMQHRLAGFRYGEMNASGSLLIVVLEGRATLELNGRVFKLTSGGVAWIIEAEWLRFSILSAPWGHLQIRFTAPSLRAPAAEHRVRQIGSKILPLATELRRVWEAEIQTPSRHLRAHGLVSVMMGHLLESTTPSDAALIGEEMSVWWQVETAVRAGLSRTYTLADLATIAGTNRVALERAAKAATGLTPIRRLRQIRMAHAQSLMRDTRLLIKEVATAVGYFRTHEFSRDYRSEFGLSPRNHRAQNFK